MKTIPKHTLDFIDSWLELTMKWENVPGLSVAIKHNDKLVFAKGYGVTNRETAEKVTPEHQFRYASHSKTFTATAILQLKEKGKLRLDDEVVRHLPWLKEHTDKRWCDVTIRQLLGHGAGVIRDGKKEDFWSLRGEFPKEDVLKSETLENELIVEPNTQLKYSNYGYGLLGLVIEAVSGKPYAEYVVEHVIEKLDLKHTTPDFDESRSAAIGYSRENLAKTQFPFPQVKAHALAPATGFSSTPSDMATFFAALAIGSGKLLSDVSKREMQHVQWKAKNDEGEYGLGLDIEERNGETLFGHSGGFPGFRSRTWHNADREITVSVVISTSGMASAIANSILATIIEFGDEPPKKELLKFEQRFATLNDTVEIIAHAGGLRKIYPNGWWPMTSIEKLKVIDDTTLQLQNVSSFENEGEKIVYEFDKNGAVIRARESAELLAPSQNGDFNPWW